MQPPQQFTARLEEKTVYNSKFTRYSFELENPHRLDFNAGQYVSIKVNEKGERRAYSICSSPDIKHGFELLIDVSPGGVGVQYFNNLNFGDKISFLAPMGQFFLQEDPKETSITLIATGSGIAPMRSMVLWLLQAQHDKRPITLYWGLRYVEDMIWQNDFEDLSEAFSNFKFHPVLSKAPGEWPLCKGHVTDCLSLHKLHPNSGYYLCGSSAMITDTKETLIKRDILEPQIHHEKFY